MISLDYAIELMEAQVGELYGVTGVVLYANDILYYLREYQRYQNTPVSATRELEGVINSIENLTSDYECSSKFDESGNWVLVDKKIYHEVLNYLRERRKIEDDRPLIWDELKAMKGKPVWIEENIDEKWIGGWDVIKQLETFDNGTESVLFISSNWYDDDDFGETWRVFRSERK